MKNLIDLGERMADNKQLGMSHISYEWWSTSKIAAFLDIGERQVRDRISKDGAFPKARKALLSSCISQPRWRSDEVVEWAEKSYLTDDEISAKKKIGRPRKISSTATIKTEYLKR
ncbi:hypothetical protein [Zhongshania borealis]|uniref:DNA-binding protein n=1 Tax=Zhongshania borealis TaxID=889488 RepID=A0ABP7W9T1_9GAMM